MCMGHGQQPMDEESYDVILKLLKGEFSVPVASRTRVQRNAIIKNHHNETQKVHKGDTEDRETTMKATLLKLCDQKDTKAAKKGHKMTREGHKINTEGH